MSSEGEQDEGRQVAPELKPDASDPAVAPARRELLPLPGLAVIALYMLVLSGVDILGIAGGHIRPIYLIFAVLFIAAGLGLLLLFRWAWTLTLAAVVLLMGLFLWRFSSGRDLPSLAQGLLNLVIFLYLIRPEVRMHLR
jgi:glycerol-3-phosphate acyltransferase PlsY